MTTPTTDKLSPADLTGNRGGLSNHEFLAASLTHWKHRLGFCSMFAALPALIASHTPAARSNEIKEPQKSVAERQRPYVRFNKSYTTPALLRLQSKFRLPHQRANFKMLAPFAGNDDCPGQFIPGANYTTASPYTDFGDTTGANNTINRLTVFYYYYYSFPIEASGADQIYAFTLIGRGSHPKIQISTTSSTYKPLAYVLDSRLLQGCPAGTGNEVFSPLLTIDSRWPGIGNTLTFDGDSVRFLPLNVPLYLVVDSAKADAMGSGPYTIRIEDVTIADPACANLINCPDFFVRQHYLDFLNREPDVEGLAYWTNELTQCGGDAHCMAVKRIHVSAAFFLSIEFQQSGYLVYRMYKAAYGDRPNAPVPLTRQEFLADTQRVAKDVVVGKAGWEQQLATNTNIFANEFSNRSRFTNAFPAGMSNEAFVNALNTNAGGVLTQDDRNQLVSDLVLGIRTRGEVLKAVAENPNFARNEFNKAFVLMQYFGYLQRNPNEGLDRDFTGYNSWLTKLNQFGGDFVAAEMVKAFLDSTEYKRRFGT